MAGSTNNITIKLKVDGSEDAVRAVDNVKSSVDQITKAQADLIRQKAKEIELDGALRRSLEARAKIAKEDMQRARISEYKSMQEVLRAEREIGSEIKKRAGEIANARKASHAEVMDKRDQISLTRDLTRLDRQRALDRLAILKQEANVQSANHRAEINRIKAEKAAARQQGSGDRRSSFFAPAVSAIGKGFGISEERTQGISKFLDTLGRTNLALLVVSKAIGEVFSLIGAFANSMIQASLAADQYNLKIKSLEIVTRSGSQTFGQAYQTFIKFNDSLQSEDSLITAIRTFSTLGISAQQSNQLIEGLRNGIVAMGGDVSEQLPLMALAFKRQESALLDNAGITANLDVMYKEYAKSIGTTVDKLTTQQKVQASIVGSLKELNQYQGLSGISADSLSGRMNRLNAESERLKRTLGIVAMPLSNAFIEIGIALTKAQIELSNFFAMFTRGAKEVVNSPEYKMLRGGREASTTVIGGEFTAQRMGLTQEVTTRIKNTEYQGQLESQLKIAEQAQEKAFLALAKRLGTSTSNLGRTIFKSGKNSLIEEYKAIITGPARAISEYIRTTPSADAASKAGTGGAITEFQPGRGGRVSTTFRTPGKITQGGITEQTRQEATDLFLRRVQDNALSQIESFNAQADASRNKSANREIKTAKDLFLERVKLNKEDMQSQTTVNNIFTVRKRIVDLIDSAKKGVINQNQAQTMTLQVNQESADLVEAAIKRSSQQEMLEYRILKAKKEIGNYNKYTNNEELNNAVNLVESYNTQAKALEKIQKGLGDTLLNSSAYAEALENVAKLTRDVAEENSEAFGEKFEKRLQDMITAHRNVMMDDPESEIIAYKKFINTLEQEKEKLKGNDKETIDSISKLDAVIAEANNKLSQSQKELFVNTSENIRTAIKLGLDLFQTDFSTAFTNIGGMLGESIIKNLSESDAVQNAIKPMIKVLTTGMASAASAITGIITSVSGFVMANPVVLLLAGIAAGIGAIINGAMVAANRQAEQFRIKSEETVKKIKDESEPLYGQYQDPRSMREQRLARIKSLQEMIPQLLKSKDLAAVGQAEDSIKRLSFALDNDLSDPLSKASKAIKKMTDEAERNQRKQNSSAESFRFMNDLSRKVAYSRIDSDEKLGKITKEEADKRKAALDAGYLREDTVKNFLETLVGQGGLFVTFQKYLPKFLEGEGGGNLSEIQGAYSVRNMDGSTTNYAAGRTLAQKIADEALGQGGGQIGGQPATAANITKTFEMIAEFLRNSGIASGGSANMPGSSPDKPMYTQVVNVRDFREAFPDSAYFRAPSVDTTRSLNANSVVFR
jgi:hypothetical protein